MTLAIETKDVVQSRLKELIYERNTERVRRGKKPLTIRQIAEHSGVSASAITGLTTNRATRYDNTTLQALCRFFNCEPGDILEYLPDEEDMRKEPVSEHTPTKEEFAQQWEQAARESSRRYIRRKLAYDPWLEAE